MTSKKLMAELEALDAREVETGCVFWDERVRLTYAIHDAQIEELHARVKRLLKTWPPDVIAALREPKPPRPCTPAGIALRRRKLIHCVDFDDSLLIEFPLGFTVVRWTYAGIVARKLLGVAP